MPPKPASRMPNANFAATQKVDISPLGRNDFQVRIASANANAETRVPQHSEQRCDSDCRGSTTKKRCKTRTPRAVRSTVVAGPQPGWHEGASGYRWPGQAPATTI